MNIQALRVPGGLDIFVRAGVDGKPMRLRRKTLYFFDTDVPDERRKYEYWMDRFFPQVVNVTGHEHWGKYVKKHEEHLAWIHSSEYELSKQLDEVIKKYETND